jgi:hypothetical protein
MEMALTDNSLLSIRQMPPIAVDLPDPGRMMAHLSHGQFEGLGIKTGQNSPNDH